MLTGTFEAVRPGISAWEAKWFQETATDGQCFHCIHALGDPEFDADAAWFQIDLGSAPVLAMVELLGACANPAISAVQLGVNPSLATTSDP